MKWKKVSIVIPLYNAEDYIRSCLKAIFSQDYPREQYEVIVVDNNSTDRSAEVAKEFNVTLISLPECNISKVRNYGASHASGEIIGFIDSDCVIDKNWIKEAVRVLEDESVGAAGAGYVLPSDASWVEKAWFIESKVPFRYVNFIPSGNCIFKSSVFKKVGGFDVNLETCEDADICERITKNGYKIVNTNRLKNMHLRNYKTIYQMFLKERWYGENMIVSLRNNLFDKVFIFSISFILLHVLIITALIAHEKTLFFLSLLSIIIFLSIVTIRRIAFSRKYKMFFHTSLLYYIYFLARSLSLLSYSKLFLKRYLMERKG